MMNTSGKKKSNSSLPGPPDPSTPTVNTDMDGKGKIALLAFFVYPPGMAARSYAVSIAKPNESTAKSSEEVDGKFCFLNNLYVKMKEVLATMEQEHAKEYPQMGAQQRQIHYAQMHGSGMPSSNPASTYVSLTLIDLRILPGQVGSTSTTYFKTCKYLPNEAVVDLEHNFKFIKESWESNEPQNILNPGTVNGFNVSP